MDEALREWLKEHLRVEVKIRSEYGSYGDSRTETVEVSLLFDNEEFTSANDSFSIPPRCSHEG